ITTPLTAGTLVGAHDDHMPACAGGMGGPDRILSLTIPAVSQLTIDTNGSAITDTVLSLLPATCAEPSLACDDDSGDGNHSSLPASNLAAGTYLVAVDAYSSNTTLDTFVVNVSGTLLTGASCEPADTLGGALVCPSGSTCKGTPGAR